MFLFISILIIVACILLTLVVLIQNPKGGGIAANFTAPNQIMGARRSTDVVEKATWILAGILIVLSLSSNFFRPSAGEVSETSGPESRLKENIENTNLPPVQQQPQAQPTPTPDQQQQQPQGEPAQQPQPTP